MEKAVWDLKSQFEEGNSANIFDCMIAESLLSEGKYIPGEASTLERYAVTSLEALAEKQRLRLVKSPRLADLYASIELPLAAVLYHMEKKGIMLDAKKLHTVGNQIQREINISEEKIRKEFGIAINLNSSVQVGNFLAEKMGVPLKKTKTGRYATNETELAQYAKQFPVIDQILTYRELSKLHSTYVESLIDKVDENGRVHTTYQQVAVSTGRLSSSNPNLQNIPVSSEFGQKIKSCFIADKGNVLLSFDYSQQELRILAHLTEEEKLITAFKNGEDVHRITASRLFSVDYEAVTKQQRMVGKTINFGIIYGMSSFGMSQGLAIPVDQAQGFIDTFYATYPKIQTFYEKYLKEARVNGYVETLLGRKRYVFEHPKQKFIDNSMRRVLMNYPIQGTAADLMKKAMIDIDRDVLSKEKDIDLLLQIHDDLVFEVPESKERIDRVIETVSSLMCSVYPLRVPIEVEVKIGKNWGEMEQQRRDE